MKHKDPLVTETLAQDHGLTSEEYATLQRMAGRVPTFVELGIVSAMWNEHCSYKSSKKWLKTLPTEGTCVISGPGENAGVIDIGDGDVVMFKMESHNHPSFIEPYQGAATGVGGILRDVFAMGARPIALLNALRFGSPTTPKMRALISGVVSGIGGYGNSFGVPTLGGEVNFHPRYDGNILLNAMALGIAKRDGIFYSKAYAPGFSIVYLGAKTGRDGVGGATMASAEFSEDVEQKRPTVQVGDPFVGKCLLEACLALMASGVVSAIQDMGAAGLTCSAVEMGSKGNLGIELDLERVPCRDPHITPYERMLSESQERMLLVMEEKNIPKAQEIAKKWGVDCEAIGKTAPHDRFIVRFFGDVVADLPIQGLTDLAPSYDRPWHPPKLPAPIDEKSLPEPDFKQALLKILGSPDGASKRWVWEQYDTLILSNTLEGPGGNAGVIRVSENKALALTSDVTPRYVEADPFEGTKQAVAECWRNLISVGATPLAITDNLNFGNPENPNVMGQFVRSIAGIREACLALSFPVVSGNVSLYNETSGYPILPTPTIGGVGVLALENHVTMAFKKAGEKIFLVGGHGQHLGQSLYLREVFGREEGLPPSVDLEKEKRNGLFIKHLIASHLVTAVHDLSDGGVLIALCEMALAGHLGCTVALPAVLPSTKAACLFGEDQGRYVITTRAEDATKISEIASSSGVLFEPLGDVGGTSLEFSPLFSVELSLLRHTHESWFPEKMAGV